MATERDEGGPGGFREGVGKTGGLGEADKESDMGEEKGGGERERAVLEALKVTGWTGRTNERVEAKAGMTSLLSALACQAPRNLRMLLLVQQHPHYLYYTLSSLAAFIILSFVYSYFSGPFGRGKNKKMSLTVKWGRERSVRLVSFRFDP